MYRLRHLSITTNILRTIDDMAESITGTGIHIERFKKISILEILVIHTAALNCHHIILVIRIYELLITND